MDKLKFETPDLTAQNIEKIAALFPNCVTEMQDENGKIKRGINFEMLKQMLLPDVVDGDECYEFTWVGKKAAIAEANKPIRKTLRPCPDESKDWDTTENLYVEGDNLEVLKLLQEAYLGKVKMIYIDPPYNTGNDFIYAVIFISIDINEQQNLRKICDEVFGESNFITDFIWNSRKSVSNDAVVSLNHNYTLLYAKNMVVFYENKAKFKLPDRGKGFENSDNDIRGAWKADPFDSPGVRPNLTYGIVNPNTGEEFWPPAGRCWRTGEKEYLQFLADGRIVFGKTGKGKPQLKRFFTEAQGKGITPKSLWDDVGTATDGTRELQALFGEKVFDTPKPVSFISRIVQLSCDKDSVILDFFSGSATTAHAVMQLNAEDGGHRKFIMVQLPEPCDEKSEAYKAGYKNICEIGKERIRRAGEKIKAESPLTTQDLDIGFRVLKLDDSNMKDVYYAADDYEQGNLMDMISNIKEDRIDLDLLFGCLLDWGLPLSMPYKSEQIDGCTVHTYNDGDLIACFDANVSEDVVKEIARRKPLRAVFRDSSFADSPSKINVFEIFKLYMPEDANDISNRVRVI